MESNSIGESRFHVATPATNLPIQKPVALSFRPFRPNNPERRTGRNRLHARPTASTCTRPRRRRCRFGAIVSRTTGCCSLRKSNARTARLTAPTEQNTMRTPLENTSGEHLRRKIMSRFKRSSCVSGLVGLGAILLLSSTPAYAQATQLTTGRVATIQIDPVGVIYITLEGAPFLCGTATSRIFARLHTDYPGRNAEAVRNQLSLLTAAKLSSRTINIVAQNATTSAPNSQGYCTLLTVDVP